MEIKQIEIDFDVHREIEKRRLAFSDTPNQVLRRVFNLEPTQETLSKTPLGHGLSTKGVLLREGMRLRATYKHQQFEAIVEGGSIRYGGKSYHSPSAAANAVTGTSVNGWLFWEYYSPEQGNWRQLSNLRR